MKKILISMIILWSMASFCYAQEPSGFIYMLGVMDIPVQNQNGYSINEEIYQKYQLFVYGSPEMITSRTTMERC